MKYFTKSNKEGYKFVVYDDKNGQILGYYKTLESLVKDFPNARYKNTNFVA